MTAVAQQTRDPAHVQAYHDADAAMSMARAIWKETGLVPANDVLQATLATILIHIKDTRKQASESPSKSQAVRGATPAPRAAPAQGGGFPSACLECGGAIYDNRSEGDSKPAWRCKDKTCKKNGKFQTSAWDFQPKRGKGGNTSYAKQQERPAPSQAEDFEEMPEALAEDDDLPF